MLDAVKYSGSIKENLFNGIGTLSHVDGICLSGQWSQGRLVEGGITFNSIPEVESI